MYYIIFARFIEKKKRTIKKTLCDTEHHRHRSISLSLCRNPTTNTNTRPVQVAMDVQSLQYAAWCTAGTIFWLIVGHFIADRWRNITMGVRENIERYNRIDAERRLRDADELVRRSGGCHRCFPATTSLQTSQASLPTTITIQNPLSQTLLHLTGSTITESDTDPVVLLEEDLTHNLISNPVLETRRTPADARRLRSIQRRMGGESTSAAVTATGDVKILEICRTQSIVSRLAEKFEKKTVTAIGVSSGQPNQPNAVVYPVTTEEFQAMERRTTQKCIVFEKTDDAYELDETRKLYDDQEQVALNGFTASSNTLVFATASPLTPPQTEDDDDDDDNNDEEFFGKNNNDTTTSNGLQIRRSSLDDILIDGDTNGNDDAVHLRRRRSVDLENDVRTFEEVMRQARFSKCFSEYSISDLLLDLAASDDEPQPDVAQVRDTDLATMFARIQ